MRPPGLGRRRLLIWGATAAALLVAGVVLRRFSFRASSPSTSPSVDYPDGVTAAQFDLTADRLRHSTGKEPQRADVYSLLADDAAARGDFAMAVACFQMISTTDPRYGHAARFQQGQLLVRLNRIREAERCLQEFLQLESKQPRLGKKAATVARTWLRYLLSVQLRFEERQALLQTMHDRGELDVPWTLIYCFPNYNHWNVSDAVVQIERFLAADRENLNLRVALGRYRIAEGRCDEAREILERCRRESPSDLSAAAALLACLHETNDWKRSQEVLAELPPPADDEPWLLTALRGHGYNRKNEFRQAAACFRRLIDRMPTNAEAHLGLATSLAGLNQFAERKTVLHKAKIIARIQSRTGALKQDPGEILPLVGIAELCESVALFEQAWIVVELAQRKAPSNARAKELSARLMKRRANGGER